MALTDVDICNQSLLLLGALQIGSLDTTQDTSANASICAALYPTFARTALGSYMWRFATKKAKLGRLVAAPLTEWTYAFQLPSDRVAAPHAVFHSDQVGARPFQVWEIFQDQLLADQPDIWIDYRYRAHESVWPDWFVSAVAAGFAAQIGMAVTDKSGIVDTWRNAAYGPPAMNGGGGLFQQARIHNDSTNPTEAIATFDLVEARRS